MTAPRDDGPREDGPRDREGRQTDQTTARRAARIRLPGFVTDEQIGLGDVVTRVTQAAGVTPCGACKRRAARLNRWIVFTGSR